ncbi:MAG: hypothetical protein AAFY46_04710, partial [Planctomycetota bacterium]
MNGTIWLWWLGAVALSGVGTWLVLRGLFGHRRIASRTRRCPRCKYDMTGRPGEMTCTECGFTAADEARLYGGRRRWWVVVLGVLGWISGVAMLIVPESMERRGVAWALPAPIRDRFLVELVVLDDRTAGQVVRDAVERVASDTAEPTDHRLLERVLEGATDAMAKPGLTSERARGLNRLTRLYRRVAWAVDVEIGETELDRLLNSPHQSAVALGCAHIAWNPHWVPTFESRLTEIGSTVSAPPGNDAFIAFVNHGVETEDFAFPEGMWQWRGAGQQYRLFGTSTMLHDNESTRAWVLESLRQGELYAIDAVEEWSKLWRRDQLWSDEEIEPFVRALVTLLISPDRPTRNRIASALERSRDVHVPIIASAIGEAPTPSLADDLMDVLSSHDGDASASLPYIEAYALDTETPFRWARGAASEHRSIRRRARAEDTADAVFMVPVYRRRLHAVDWDDPQQVFDAIDDILPHRDASVVVLSEMILEPGVHSIVEAFARDAAERFRGDLVRGLEHIAEEDDAAPQIRELAAELA